MNPSGDGCRIVTCGRVETSLANPCRPRTVITGGGDRDSRPLSPLAEETAESPQGLNIGFFKVPQVILIYSHMNL